MILNASKITGYSIVLFLISFIYISCGQKGPVSIISPDGKLQVTVTTKGGETGTAPMYGVTFNESLIVSNSHASVSSPIR